MNRIDALNEIATRLTAIGVASKAAHQAVEAANLPRNTPEARELRKSFSLPITKSCDEVFALLLKHFDGDRAEIAANAAWKTELEVTVKVAREGNVGRPLDVVALAEARDAVVVVMVMTAMLSYERAAIDAAYSKHFADFAEAYRPVIL